jgi:galactokinase
MHNEAAELRDAWVDFDSPMQLRELREVAVSGSYFSYVAGVASYIKEHYNVGGMKITIKSMTLPMKSGLSSSAAICVLVARAFNLLYELNLNTMGEMNIAFRGGTADPLPLRQARSGMCLWNKARMRGF